MSPIPLRAGAGGEAVRRTTGITPLALAADAHIMNRSFHGFRGDVRALAVTINPEYPAATRPAVKVWRVFVSGLRCFCKRPP